MHNRTSNSRDAGSLPPVSVLKGRNGISRDKFSSYFAPLKAQAYHDNPAASSRGTPANGVNALAWNPLSQLIATGAGDKSVRVWNPEKPNYRYSTELKGHTSGVEKVAFNPTKDAELCSASEGGTVRFWDVRTKQAVKEIKNLGPGCTSLTWAPDGSSVIVGNKVGRLSVLSPTNSEPVAVRQQPTRTHQMSFCWSGQKVFVPTSEGKIRILSYPSLEPAFRLDYAQEGQSDEIMLKGHFAACYAAELSPIGKYLATGGADSIIALWDTKDWLCQKTITSLSGPVRSLSFTYDGNFVVGGCEETPGLVVFHVDSGEQVHTVKTAGPCQVAAWAPTRYWLAYVDLGILRIVGVDSDRRF